VAVDHREARSERRGERPPGSGQQDFSTRRVACH
jgi:hypothetical protein